MVGSWTTYYFGLSVIMLLFLNMVHFHFTVSLKGPLIANSIFKFFFMVWPLDNFQGALDFHGHNTWFMRKAALNMGR